MIKAIYEATEKSIVIIGTNSGIGQALTKQLLASGGLVFGIDIQDESFIPQSNEYRYFKTDPLSESDLQIVVEKIEKHVAQIDGLVNLSGTIRHFKPIEKMSIEAWNETYDISFKSCFNGCKAFVRLMKNTQSAIVNMSSGLAFIGQKNYGPYTTAKAAVVSFSKTLAVELAPNIRVNTIAPGAVDTNFIYKEDGSTRFDKERYVTMVPLGGMAKPDEISSVILFLLSDGSSHITGQCIHVNGGL